MKRLLAMLLALVMVLSLFPATALTAFAEEALVLEEVAEPTEAPAEEIIEEPAEEPAEEPVEEPAKEPAKKNEGSGVCSGHVAGTVNGSDACLAEDGSLHVCAVNFNDGNFRNYILEVIDTDGSGYLDAEELATKTIYCSYMEINSLQGIEYFAGLAELSCDSNSLTELDVSANTELNFVSFNNNKVTAIDLTNNLSLVYLDCSFNPIDTLDISKNTALTHLWANETAVGNLDISQNTALTNVGLGGVGMTELDISDHDDLVVLQIWGNEITALDLKEKTKLEHLNVNANKLTALDLSDNTALQELYCGGNQLTSLDVSKHTALTMLSCGGNPLTELDVSNNTALQELGCFETPLAELDVSKNTALEGLRCSDTNITVLDLSKNTALKDLSCGGTNITVLDVSANTKLVDLICRNGALEELILPEGYGLQHVYCNGNNLTELDLSGVSRLEWLDVSYNNLTKLDLSNNTNLYSVVCNNNALTQLDLPADVEINELVCDNQYWYGELPVSINEEGWHEVDLSGITNVNKIYRINTEGECELYPSEGIVAFENDPSNGFSYEYMTGLGELTITCNINVPQDDGGEDPEDPEYIILDIPAIEDMTQLFLEEEAVVQWQEGDGYKWFYFVPEEDMVVTFLTTVDINDEERLDPCAYWVNENGEVITYSDDHNDINSAIYVDAVAGETHYFAVRNINSLTGPLPVVILEGDHMQGGGSGDEMGQMTVPPLEDMIQLTLGETYTPTWSEETDFLWFYFIPEEDVEATFITLSDMAGDGGIDPKARMVAPDGTVVAFDDDGGENWNSAICDYFAAGETYLFAIWDTSGMYDYELPVALLEGNHFQGGGSGGDGPGSGEDFSAIAPPIEEMTVLTLDTEFIADIPANDEVKGYAWFTFTPEETATYAFVSKNIMGGDPFCTLLDSDLNEIVGNDDGAGDLNFSVVEELEAGQTYVFAATKLGEDACSYPVVLTKAKTVTDISVKPISIPEHAWTRTVMGYIGDGDVMTMLRYFWLYKMETTLTFSDGNTVTGTGDMIEHEGICYELKGWDTQDFDTPWSAGNTYDVTVACGNIKKDTTVTITKSMIKSISAEDMILSQDAGEEYGEDEVIRIYYSWSDILPWTVTFTDGKKVSGSGIHDYELQGWTLEYKGDRYLIETADDQYGDHYWEAGNTYTGVVNIGNLSKEVDVTIRGTAEDLAKVEDLLITDEGETSLKIKFGKVEGAERYEIYVNGSYWGNTTKTTYTISGLELGKQYQITVAAAKKVAGAWHCGPMSDEAWGVTCKDISDYYAKLEYTSTVYDGTEKKPAVTLKTSSSGKTIGAEHYGVHYSDCVMVGQGVVMLIGELYMEGRGEYGGILYKDFKILPQQVTGVEVVESSHNSATIVFEPVEGATEYWIYRGDTRVAKIPDPTYTYTYTGLKAGTTYKFSVRANAVVDEYQLDDWDPMGSEDPEIKQKDYTGAASEKISFKPTYRMEDCEVTVKDAVKAYTGKKITNSFTVKNIEGKTLKKDTDYTVSYENNVELGAAIATLKGKGKYAGEIQRVFFIGPNAVKDVEAEAINGTSVEVTFDEQKGADYYYIYADGIHVGTTDQDEYTITGLTAGHKYSITVAAMINHENVGDLVGVQSKAVTVTPRHDLLDFVTGAYIHFDDGEFWTCNYTGKKVCPAVDVWVNHGNGEEMLVPGEDFVVEYKNNKNVGVATLTIKGTGAYYGSMNKVEFAIIPAMVTNLKVKDSTETSVTLGWTKTKSASYYEIYMDGEYVGKTTGSSYKIKNLVAGEEHNFSVVSCKKVSSKYGVFSSEWEFISAHAGKHVSDLKISLEYSEVVYDGEPHEPAVTVKDGNVTLVENVDYTVRYMAVVVPGEAAVTIEGIGKYTGTVTKTFDIVPAQVSYVFAQAVTNTRMEVVWDEVPGATEYWVYVNGSRKAKVSDTVCTIKNLKKGKTYKVTVKAVAEVDGEDFVGAASEVQYCYMGVKDAM